jgi:hypothetical protein
MHVITLGRCEAIIFSVIQEELRPFIAGSGCNV